MKWVKRHKVWTGLLIILIIAFPLDVIGVIDVGGFYTLLGLLLAIKFILFGWKRKKRAEGINGK